MGDTFYQNVLQENENASQVIFHVDNLGSTGTGGTEEVKISESIKIMLLTRSVLKNIGLVTVVEVHGTGMLNLMLLLELVNSKTIL